MKNVSSGPSLVEVRFARHAGSYDHRDDDPLARSLLRRRRLLQEGGLGHPNGRCLPQLDGLGMHLGDEFLAHAKALGKAGAV
eukprot:CAMPEP_0179854874 /NCGR_PEP_ID=MMETSP0982-20121206/10199_1 /TAXON_ID=483367 /ORGANISM="non described non described, Strain CCMP 2436" /LENGTH=81 /DNA_ID=CAMNT_0021740855 /DNA_START=37 /DNA_END=282 /DNA_ORIENTATION=+